MKQSKWFYWLVSSFFRLVFKIYNRCTVKWLEKLNPDERFIVACNHCSNLDPLIIGSFFPRRLLYFAKEELFHSWFLRTSITALGAIPVSRADNATAAMALKGFMRFYREGHDVLIFPEGGRSLDGKLQPLEAGVALIAAHENAPILPAFISGSFESMPPGSSFVRPSRMSITFGKVLRFSPELCKTREAREVIMSELTEALKALESSAAG